MKRFLLLFILLALPGSLWVPAQASPQSKFTIKVTVIARGFMSKLILYPGPTRFRDDLLAKVENGDDGIRAGDFVRIIYEKSAAEEGALPESMFSARNVWQFTLTRDETCDKPMKNLLFYAITNDKGECTLQQYMQWTPWGSSEKVPLEAQVRCFSFGERDYTVLK